MGIEASDKCTFCKEVTDTVEHMLLFCPKIKDLWDRVNVWMSDIGFLDYSLSDYRKIVGTELHHSHN